MWMQIGERFRTPKSPFLKKTMDRPSGELLQELQERLPGAADEVLARYLSRLQALVQSRLGGLLSRRVDPDDIVQSALRSFFVRAVEGDFNLEQPGDLWRLLATITLRKVARTAAHHRAAKRDIRREGDADFAVTSLEPTAADSAAAAEELIWLMKRLSAESRQALQLRLNGFEIQEIAARLKRSERTIRRWMNDIRSLMHSRLEQFDRSHSASPISSEADTSIDLVDGAIIASLDPRDYVLHRLIGSGGVCKVYAATQRSTGRRFCVKVLRRPFRHEPRLVRRFAKETEIGGKLSHPRIVRILGLGRLADGGYFLVMDLIDGPNLAQYSEKNKLLPAQAARLVAEVADAVEHAHSFGIIHCDLKPANILIDESGSAWLTDFGFAHEMKTTFGFSDNRYIAGTAAYLAPEQFVPSLGTIGPATDVHGLGAVLFTLLSGQPPYSGDTLSAVEFQASDRRPRLELLTECPKPIVDICRTCLERSPDRRFPSARSVASHLRAIVSEGSA